MGYYFYKKGLTVKRAWKFIYWLVSLGVVLAPEFFWKVELSGTLKYISITLGVLLLSYSLIIASIAGRTLRLFAHKNLKDRNFWPDKFTDTGIYSCMRHPMHLGLSLLPLSVALILTNIISIVAGGWGVAMGVLFVLMIEEPQALDSFGDDYCRYIKRVKAFNLSLKCIKVGIEKIFKLN